MAAVQVQLGAALETAEGMARGGIKEGIPLFKGMRCVWRSCRVLRTASIQTNTRMVHWRTWVGRGCESACSILTSNTARNVTAT